MGNNVGELSRKLNSESNSHARYQIVDELGKSWNHGPSDGVDGVLQAISVLRGLMNDPDPEMRAHVGAALGNCLTGARPDSRVCASVIPLLAVLAQDPNSFVRDQCEPRYAVSKARCKHS